MTTAVGNDDQVLQPGQWVVNAPCVGTGEDGISQTVAMTPAYVQQIPVGNGEPHTIGILPGPDGDLDCLNHPTFPCPQPDDQLSGVNITTGANGILNSYADAPAYGIPSVMTSELLLPIPRIYKSDDLDQARLHLKHP